MVSTVIHVGHNPTPAGGPPEGTVEACEYGSTTGMVYLPPLSEIQSRRVPTPRRGPTHARSLWVNVLIRCLPQVTYANPVAAWTGPVSIPLGVDDLVQPVLASVAVW